VKYQFTQTKTYMLKSLNKKMHIDFKTSQEALQKTFESEKGKS
jgi:hypothetical protein